ncbi:uncharacterized protein [Medicago truncatula]|uniref:uncharacterized protein isoform X4 n=1 Tax=Medicago truncatula TaxID=3880 RepID=UPI001968A3C1|nr:uncharacterized protein LOC112417572 isoform X4 [Medicago truncatula]
MMNSTMAKRKGRGQPKASSLLKKVKHSANVEPVVLNNPSYELEVDLGFVEELETGTMAKRNLRDRPKASSLQKKVKQSANVKTGVLDNTSNELEVDPELVEEQETGTMPKRNLRDQPKVSTLQKKVKQSADVKTAVLDNQSNELEVDPEFVEEQETGTMAKRKGRGRPKASNLLKKVKQSANVKTAVFDNPLNELEVDPKFVEEQETGTISKRNLRGRPKVSSLQKQGKQSTIVKTAVLDNPSNEFEVDLEFIEEQATGTIAKRKLRGRPKASSLQKQVKQSANVKPVVLDNPSNDLEVDPKFVEEEETGSMAKRKGRCWPKVSSFQKKVKQNSNVETVVLNNPSNELEVAPDVVQEQENQSNESEDDPDFVEEQETELLMQRGPGRPRRSMNQKNHRQNADDTRVRPKNKVRGQTRGLMLEMKRKLSRDGKMDVDIHPTRLVAVGPGRNDFITDLSIIVRKNARFNVNKWSSVPQSTKDTIVEKVLNNWRLQDTDVVRKAIINEAGRLYRSRRHRLHEHYLKFETKEEALKHIPDDVNESDWKFLVDYFSSPSFEIRSIKNKASKAKQRIHHTSGPKSFQAASFDARDPVTGKEPDLQTLWQITHKKANGEWVNEASKQIHDKVAEQINESMLENSQDEVEVMETAFKSVVGKQSYMQGFGEGLRSARSSVRVQELQAELDAQRVEAENARKECNELRAKLVEVESQLAEERRKREESEARLLYRQKDMQEINSHVQTAIQSALSQYCPRKTDEETSSDDKEKIAELEAQLHEAEDVITDIRAELARYRLY